MSRRPLPEPSSGFRPGDLLRLALAISFMVLIVLAIVRFRNPATWQWVRNVPQRDTSSQVPADSHPAETESPPSNIPGQPGGVGSAPEVFELGQLGVTLAAGTASLMSGQVGEHLAVSLLALEALAYATPVPKAHMTVTPPKPSRLRFVLTPDWEILRGARDREGFLVEPAEAADNPFFRQERQDANARYHLIALVLEQARGGPEGFLRQLHQDAIWNVPYELLRDKPQRYRGEVIGLRGTLVWVKRFALERGGSGGLPEYVYQGVLEQDGLRERPVWLLFTHLPDNMPPEKEWLNLFAAETTFVGYYLKVVGIEPPPEPPRARAANKPRPTRLYFPVLVGYTVELPPPPPGQNWFAVLLIVAGIVGGIVLMSAIALYFYYRSERPYLEKIAQVRERVARREEVAEPTEPFEPGPMLLENWNGNASDSSSGSKKMPPDGPAGNTPAQ